MKKGLFYISTAFILSLVIILYLSWLYYQSFTRSNNYISKMEHAYKVVLQTSELENYIKEAETGQRGYLLTRDSNFLRPYLDIRHNIRPAYDSLRRLTADNITQQNLLAKAGLLINNSIDRFHHSIYLFNTQNRNLSQSLEEGRIIVDSLRLIFNLL